MQALILLVGLTFGANIDKHIVQLQERNGNGAKAKELSTDFVSFKQNLQLTLQRLSNDAADLPSFFKRDQQNSVDLILRQNENIISQNYKEAEVSFDGQISVTPFDRNSDWNCFYQGHLVQNGEEIPNSVVAVSACKGIEGLIIHQNQIWDLQPTSDGSYQFSKGRPTEENENWCSKNDTNDDDHFEDSPQSSSHNPNRRSTCLDVQMVIVNDYNRYRDLTKDVQTKTIATFNIASAVYAKTPFTPCLRLVLGGQITFASMTPTGWYRYCNTINPARGTIGCHTSTGTLQSTSSSEIDSINLLTSFNSWWNAQKTTIQTIFSQTFDSAHFWTSANFEAKVLGYAYQTQVCGMMTGVEQMTNSDTANAMIFSHELGHNLGMTHTTTASIMSASTNLANPSTVFLNSSITQVNTAMVGKTCLVANSGVNMTTNAVCGNGILEGCEECDPGSEADSCCVNCRINRPTCQCANTQPCCLSGQFRPAGTTCRPSIHSTCDAAETCSGTSGLCPVDIYSLPDTPCTDSLGFTGNCFERNCQSSRTTQCRTASNGKYPYDTACSTVCNRLYCSFNTTSCGSRFWNLAVGNGSPCTAGSYCFGGACQPLSFFTSRRSSNPFPPPPVC